MNRKCLRLNLVVYYATLTDYSFINEFSFRIFSSVPKFSLWLGFLSINLSFRGSLALGLVYWLEQTLIRWFDSIGLNHWLVCNSSSSCIWYVKRHLSLSRFSRLDNYSSSIPCWYLELLFRWLWIVPWVMGEQRHDVSSGILKFMLIFRMNFRKLDRLNCDSTVTGGDLELFRCLSCIFWGRKSLPTRNIYILTCFNLAKVLPTLCNIWMLILLLLLYFLWLILLKISS